MFCIDLKRLHEQTGGQPRRAVDLADLIVVRARPLHPQNLLYNGNLLPFEYLTDRDGLRENLATFKGWEAGRVIFILPFKTALDTIESRGSFETLTDCMADARSEGYEAGSKRSPPAGGD
jgi:hypothetical protein